LAEKIKMDFFPAGRLWMLTLAGLLMAAGCQGGKYTPEQKSEAAGQLPEKKTMKAKTTRQPAQAYPVSPGAEAQRIPPGACRLVGKVVAILPQRDADKQAPCGQVPCRAQVRVERVVGYGAAFQPPLAEGQQIKVYSTFTLSPTGKYFPELATPLPGLPVGSLFEADITTLAEAATAQERWFRVTTYQARP
jgi:hypothetical protein